MEKNNADRLPKGWIRIPLGDILSLEYGKGLVKNKRDNFGQVPVYGSSGIVDHHSESLTKKPCIIIGRKGSIGSTYLSPVSCWVIDTAYYIEPPEGIDLKFLFYLLSHMNLKKLDKSTTIPSLVRRIAYELEIPLCSLNEQKRIVSKIEELFSELDFTKKVFNKTKILLKQYRQSLLRYAFEGKFTEKQSEYSNEYASSSWIIRKIGDIADVAGGKRLPKGHVYSDKQTSFPYIRVLDFENLGINEKSLKYLKPETQKIIQKYTISQDDIYISIAGFGLGQVGIIPSHLDGANLTENAAKLTNIKIDKNFLCYVLASPICQEQISKLTTSSAQPKLALFRIKNISIPVPSLNEQKRITTIIDTGISLIDNNERLIDLSIKNSDILKQTILKRAFEGKLVSQDPNDESASILLEKIKQKKNGTKKY